MKRDIMRMNEEKNNTNLAQSIPPRNENGERQSSSVSFLRETKKTPDKIEPQALYRYFLNMETDKSFSPKFLVIDIRNHEDFLKSHLAGTSIVNIDPKLLEKEISSLELERKIPSDPPFHRENFMNRDKFDLVVIMDSSSTNTQQTAAIRNLRSAIYENEILKILARVPCIVVGGFDAWIMTVKTSSVVKRPYLIFRNHLCLK
jgi:rhodanese-related sulfurtransferase